MKIEFAIMLLAFVSLVIPAYGETITVSLVSDKEIPYDNSSILIRADVIVNEFDASVGQYYMKIVKLSPTTATLTDQKIFLNDLSNEIWKGQIGYMITEKQVGEYEIQIYSEFGSVIGKTEFSIVEKIDVPSILLQQETEVFEEPIIDYELTVTINEKILQTGDNVVLSIMINPVIPNEQIQVSIKKSNSDILSHSLVTSNQGTGVYQFSISDKFDSGRYLAKVYADINGQELNDAVSFSVTKIVEPKLAEVIPQSIIVPPQPTQVSELVQAELQNTQIISTLIAVSIIAVIPVGIIFALRKRHRYCIVCNSKLGIFYGKDVCKQCLEKKYNKFFLNDAILSLPKLDESELRELKKFGKARIISLYDKLLEEYTSDNIMTEEEIANLEKISKLFELTPEETKHDTIIYPHKIKNYINQNNTLPRLDYDGFKESGIRIQDDEEYYSFGISNFYEMKAHSRYIPGSRGVSIYGFRVGRVAGQRISEQLPVQKSTGQYIMTNKRFYYVSDAYGEMTKIDLKKIMSYDADPEFIIINTHTRQKPYLFRMSLINIKTTLIGLDFLLNKQTQSKFKEYSLEWCYKILELDKNADMDFVGCAYLL